MNKVGLVPGVIQFFDGEASGHTSCVLCRPVSIFFYGKIEVCLGIRKRKIQRLNEEMHRFEDGQRTGPQRG